MIRAYSNMDKTGVIDLLKKNTPAYFDFSEETDLKNYLENEIEDYFVCEKNNKIIGAGGINYFQKERLARISWDIVDPDYQGKGIGQKLVQHRIKHISKKQHIEFIVVRTTQLVYPFYQKMGFELEKIEKDFWAKNYDLYQMTMHNKTGDNINRTY